MPSYLLIESDVMYGYVWFGLMLIIFFTWFRCLGSSRGKLVRIV